MFSDHDVVNLKRDIVDVVDSFGRTVSLSAGAMGVVVAVYDARFGCEPRDSLDYEIEFLDAEGYTSAIMQLSEVDLQLNFAFEDMKKTTHHP